MCARVRACVCACVRASGGYVCEKESDASANPQLVVELKAAATERAFVRGSACSFVRAWGGLVDRVVTRFQLFLRRHEPSTDRIGQSR